MAAGTAVERFWLKVDKTDTYWLWTAAMTSAGYGNFVPRKGTWSTAHKFSYRLHFGEIPDGLYVLHTCDVRICVNPDHLSLGTHQNNMDDMAARDRVWGKGVPGPRQKLTAAEVAQIKALSHLPRPVLAERFGISIWTIADIRRGRTWGEVAPSLEVA